MVLYSATICICLALRNIGFELELDVVCNKKLFVCFYVNPTIMPLKTLENTYRLIG